MCPSSDSTASVSVDLIQLFRSRELVVMTKLESEEVLDAARLVAVQGFEEDCAARGCPCLLMLLSSMKCLLGCAMDEWWGQG